ncbi:hypothetical protein Tco_1224045, partial [Tanacetum coccineum]
MRSHLPTLSCNSEAIFLLQCFYRNFLCPRDLHAATLAHYYSGLKHQRFKVGADLLRDTLQITPIDPDHRFVEHPPHDALVSFIIHVGYT